MRGSALLAHLCSIHGAPRRVPQLAVVFMAQWGLHTRGRGGKLDVQATVTWGPLGPRHACMHGPLQPHRHPFQRRAVHPQSSLRRSRRRLLGMLVRNPLPPRGFPAGGSITLLTLAGTAASPRPPPPGSMAAGPV